MSGERKCEGCGKLLTTKQSRFCSKSCQSRRPKKRKPKGRKNLICEWCGKYLTRSQKQFCSKTCASRSRMTGRPMPEEVKVKLSESHLGKSNGPRPQEVRDKISKTLTGHTVPQKVRDKISKSVIGTYNTYQYDPDASQPEYRRKAIEAYGYKCSGCGTSENILDVHHVNGDHYDDCVDNLVVLCKSCHARIHPNNFIGDPTPDPSFTQLVLENRSNQ